VFEKELLISEFRGGEGTGGKDLTDQDFTSLGWVFDSINIIYMGSSRN